MSKGNTPHVLLCLDCCIVVCPVCALHVKCYITCPVYSAPYGPPECLNNFCFIICISIGYPLLNAFTSLSSHVNKMRTLFFLCASCCQTQSTPGLCSRPGSPFFHPGSVRSDMVIASPAACCVPGACRSTTVWTVARVIVGVRWFARGRGAVGF